MCRILSSGLLLILLGITTNRSVMAETISSPKDGTNRVVIELFVRSDSDQCHRAVEFLTQLQARRPGLDVKSYDVIDDPAALTRLWSISRSQGLEKPGVPAVYLGERLTIGFQDAATTGKQYESMLTIRVLFRPGCRHCQNAREFLDQFVVRWPAIRVEYFNVIDDPRARELVRELAQKYRMAVASFPCIEVCGRMIVGFQGESITGRQIEAIFRDRSPLPPPNRAQPASTAGTARSDIRDTIGEGATRPTPGPGLTAGPTPWSGMVMSPAGLTDEQIYLIALPSQVEPTAETVPLPGTAAPPDDIPLPSGEVTMTADEIPMPADGVTREKESGAGRATSDEPNCDDQSDDRVITLPMIGEIHVGDFGLVGLTLMIGLIDGFNPCAMWVLVFLLSVLVNIKDRRKILVIAGTFVVVSGLAYFAFMAAWFSVFQLVGLLRPVQIALGITAIVVGTVHVKDFFAFHRGITFSIPESAKPAIYRRVREIVSAKNLTVALLGAITLACAVNVVELLCTSGLPALYTEILTMRALPAWANYGYLMLYIAAYMFDDTLLVTAVVATLSHRKLQEREGRWLKMFSGSAILLIGCVMILRPDWLV